MKQSLLLPQLCWLLRKEVVQAKFIRHASTFNYEAAEKAALLKLRSNHRQGILEKADRHLQRMPTSSLVRSLVLGTMFVSPTLVRLALIAMDRIANSKSLLLSPERNGLIRYVVKRLIYDHFCAGANKCEIGKTKNAIKAMGFSGIVLCYGREIQITKYSELRSTGRETGPDKEITEWRDGTLETVDMVGEGDWIGIK